ncbi:MAG: redoxin domain-containing protein, partial [Armatimonadetes bacterium]|nr:redoxin domain-containing protein [Armatimonadota bacterium]
LVVVALMLAITPVRGQEGAPLKVGDKMPEFRLTGTDGKEYTLAQFRGKSAIAIAWYPKALTGG